MIKELIGKTITSITGVENDDIIFVCSDNTKYRMHHFQDCCESVQVDKVIGDINDILNFPVIESLEENPDRPSGIETEYEESFTWTDYTITTSKGTVVFQWLGCSNGYYGEDVEFEKITE